ncbi:polysaccharide biosynthesis/export family protein [Maribacter sp. 2307ULW6-5]|uniref:polysaccharide biosynthesis/export family protein n=1 Tax=Maribacter sp. 2307ULW6-5 TaxID=3386275 RepID=UPI0039BD7B15
MKPTLYGQALFTLNLGNHRIGLRIWIGALLLSLLFSSCGSMKKSTYFYGVSNSVYRSSEMDNMETDLRVNDLLSIAVSSVNQEAAEMFNVSNATAAESSTAGGQTTQASGYLIDKEGYIHFPILGPIKAAGRTKKELRDDISQLLTDKKLLIDPIVDVRYLNFRVSVLGEVARPEVFTVPSEKISILEALSLAGDITIYGNKQEVTLIREVEGVRVVRSLDLTTNEIFSSPYYYLQTNDVIYVEPRKGKVGESSVVRPWIPVVLSAISLAIITIVNF